MIHVFVVERVIVTSLRFQYRNQIKTTLTNSVMCIVGNGRNLAVRDTQIIVSRISFVVMTNSDELLLRENPSRI